MSDPYLITTNLYDITSSRTLYEHKRNTYIVYLDYDGYKDMKSILGWLDTSVEWISNYKIYKQYHDVLDKMPEICDITDDEQKMIDDFKKGWPTFNDMKETYCLRVFFKMTSVLFSYHRIECNFFNPVIGMSVNALLEKKYNSIIDKAFLDGINIYYKYVTHKHTIKKITVDQYDKISAIKSVLNIKEHKDENKYMKQYNKTIKILC